MEKYIGTKLIEAEPKNRAEFLWEKSGDTQWEDVKDKENEQGYKVKYPDGYESWSPKDVLEEAYRKIDSMNFGLAVEALKKGYRAARKGWNGKKQYIELATAISYLNTKGNVVNCNHDAIGNKAIAFVGTSGIQMGWLASQADMLAEDWEVVE